MTNSLVEEILRSIDQAEKLFFRLVVVVGSTGTGKTRALNEVAVRKGVPCTNLNLELCQRMLDLTERQRALQVPHLIRGAVPRHPGGIAILDNTEVLFDVTMKQDPLRLLEGLSRDRTVVAAWNGAISGNKLIYAMPGHPEYRLYPIRDFLVVGTPVAGQPSTAK